MFVDFSLITGISLGIEYTRIDDSDYLAIDLLFFRIIFEKPVD